MKRIRGWRSKQGLTGGRSLVADQSGSPAIEFALISVPLGALIVAILQIALTFFAQQNLETTAEKSVRQLITGQAQKASMTAASFKTLVCSKLPFFMKCANVIVDVQAVSDFSNATTGAPTLNFDSSGNITNNWQFAPGGPGSVNVARVMYIWNVNPGPLGFDLSTMTGSRRLLVATAVFKTEPYS